MTIYNIDKLTKETNMYLQEIPKDILPGQRVKIKYDCNGGFKMCGQESTPLYKVAKKNADANGGNHICRSCQMKANNPAKRKEVQEKIKNTCLERYGAETAMNTEENIDKKRKQFENSEFKAQWLEKHRQTSLKRYGVEHHMQTEAVKEVQKATMQERYGVDYPYQSSEIMDAMRAKNMEKYGVENVAALPEVQLKMAQTTLEKYGVEHYNQLPEMKDYLREHCKVWLAESYANPWAKGITRPEEWNQKQSETVTKLILDGKWKSGHKNTWRGYYKSDGKCKKLISFFRSGFELLYHFYLDHCDQVEWYDYEPFVINYKLDNGESHRYIPDFIVKFIDDDTLHIREVKADYLHDSLETRAKYAAAKDFVKLQLNMDYSVILKEGIYSLGINFDDIKNHPNVTIIHKPINK